MKNEILEALTIIEEEHNRTKRDIEIIKQAKQEIERLNNIIKEVREEVKIYEEQSKDGTTNELDNYVFIQRLKIVLNKGERIKSDKEN